MPKTLAEEGYVVRYDALSGFVRATKMTGRDNFDVCDNLVPSSRGHDFRRRVGDAIALMTMTMSFDEEEAD